MKTILALALTLSAAAAAAAPSVQVTTARVQRRDLILNLDVYGRIEADPRHVRTLTALSAAHVQQLQVSLGQPVQAGQTLLTLATSPQARAAYRKAQSALDSARIKLRQTRDLYRQQLATRADLAAATQARDDAAASLAAERANGANAERRPLKAPDDAIVTAVNVHAGELVQAGQPLLSLGSRRQLRAVLGIEPEDLQQLKPGMPVRLTPVFGPHDVQVTAPLSVLHAVVNPATHLVDATVDLAGARADPFVPGSWVRARIAIRHRNTLAVPHDALLEDGGAHVFVVHDGHARRVNVHVILRTPDWDGISGQLAEGDAVVVQGNYELHDGMPVRGAGNAR